MSQFQFHHGPLDEQVARIQRFLVEQSAGPRAPGSGGGALSSGGADFSGQLPEAQVAFDDTSGHDHSSGNSTAVPMAGAVTGTNQASVVTAAGDVTGLIGATSVDRIHGKTAPASPASTDAGKALRYDGSAAYVLETTRLRVRTVTGAATFGADDDVILGDATGGAFSVNLPAVATNNRRVFTLLRLNAGANALTLQANGPETINGVNTYVLAAQYQSATVACDSAAWYVVAVSP